MLDYGERPEAVIFQLENPVGIIEWSGPLGAALAGIAWTRCI
jgi:hypothetical protein